MKAWAPGLLLVALIATAQAQTREPIQFAKGASAATVKGSLSGDQTMDYTVRARAGQTMTLRFKPSNPSGYFNLLPPQSPEALHIGSIAGNEFSGVLPADGKYTVRVFLMRNAARRDEQLRYTLDVSITGTPAAASAGASAGASAPPARWDASGDVRCSVDSDAFDRQCGFRVVRDLPRQAARVWIAKPTGGGQRFLAYADRVFTTSDKAKLAWQRRDDNWWVSVNGREFYLIPDALIHGG